MDTIQNILHGIHSLTTWQSFLLLFLVIPLVAFLVSIVKLSIKILSSLFSTKQSNVIEFAPDMIPKSMSEFNVRTRLPNQWGKIRLVGIAHTKGYCEKCGDYHGNSLHCHEVWKIDIPSRTQRLAGLMGLCNVCHSVYHMGHAEHSNRLEPALKKMAQVNNISQDMAYRIYQQKLNQLLRISNMTYKLDLTYLNNKKFDEAMTAKDGDRKIRLKMTENEYSGVLRVQARRRAKREAKANAI